jgi:hypothetical protein
MKGSEEIFNAAMRACINIHTDEPIILPPHLNRLEDKLRTGFAIRPASTVDGDPVDLRDFFLQNCPLFADFVFSEFSRFWEF